MCTGTSLSVFQLVHHKFMHYYTWQIKLNLQDHQELTGHFGLNDLVQTLCQSYKTGNSLSEI